MRKWKNPLLPHWNIGETTRNEQNIFFSPNQLCFIPLESVQRDEANGIKHSWFWEKKYFFHFSGFRLSLTHYMKWMSIFEIRFLPISPDMVVELENQWHHRAQLVNPLLISPTCFFGFFCHYKPLVKPEDWWKRTKIFFLSKSMFLYTIRFVSLHWFQWYKA